MRHRFGKTVVIALGGSLVHPDGLDVAFLKKWERFLRTELRTGRRFVLAVGGGRLARRFQEAAQAVHPVAADDKDWLGIHATRLNAHLVRTIFRDVADPVVIDTEGRLRRLTRPVTVASGWQPGWSTDYIAARLAADFHVPEFVVAGKPAYVYTEDNVKHPDAKPLLELTWPAYRKMIPSTWRPGLHAPVDPVAARLAATRKLAAIVVNGQNLANLKDLLRGREFAGTIVK